MLQSLLFGYSGAKGISQEMDGLHEVLNIKTFRLPEGYVASLWTVL